MVHSKKEILERYSAFLERNLILTDDLFHFLKHEKIFPDFVFDDIQALSSPSEKNKRLLKGLIDNADVAFKKFVEGLIDTDQPFLGELLENEDRKSLDSTDDPSEKVAIDDDMLKKCPGVDKLKADTREKLKVYLQEQLLRVYLHDTWKKRNQAKSLEVVNLKRQNYETQRRLSISVENDKQVIDNLKDALRREQVERQHKEQDLKELRNEVTRIQAEFQQRLSSQINMIDANTRSTFSMHDKMVMLTEWLQSLDELFNKNIIQSGIDSDSMDQLERKLKRYRSEIESLSSRGIGTDKLKEELYEAVYTSRYLPIEDHKNKSFHELLLRLYGSNQVTELAKICTKDVLEANKDRDHANDIRKRDERIDELTHINKELNEEIERLKATIEAGKKPAWRPVPASIPAARDPGKNRQVLKPSSIQPGTKPGPTW
ncbi:unnamed protein product [Adineta steineri]|uniref:CARD domain-containing protein n=1 Tax=Adineta steineri TaxID=433720 RepID=A0A814M5S1_9BILA|nr:unnamed protein product [Adineta steineri]CAF3752096.1 unnamed protein product [Adineta steineri]